MLTCKKHPATLLCLCAALCFYNHAFGQDAKKLDSLFTALNNQKEDSNILKTLEGIGSYYKDTYPAKAISYYKRAATLAGKLHRPATESYMYCMVGYNYQAAGNFNASLEALTLAAKIGKTANDKATLCHIYLEMANVFLITGMNNKARPWLDSAENLTKQTKDDVQLFTLNNLRGTMYDNTPPYDSAMYFYNKNLVFARQIHSKQFEVGAMTNFAIIYRKKNNTEKALQYYDTILNYIDTAKWASPDNLAQLYNQIGSTWVQAGNYTKAALYFNKSLTVALQISQREAEANNYRDLAAMYAGMKDYKMQSIYLIKYYTLKDSLFGADVKNKLTQAEADYWLERKNDALLNAQAEEKAKTQQRNLLIVFVLVLMPLAIYTYLLQRKKHRQQQLLNDTRLNQQQKELTAAAEQLQELAYRIAEKNDLINVLELHVNKETDEEAVMRLQQSNIINNRDWDRFKTLFEKVHGGYLKALHEKLPGLSPAEVRFMALAKLNLSNKEMAAALGVSPQSIRVTWHRLRKKLDIADETTVEELVETIL